MDAGGRAASGTKAERVIAHYWGAGLPAPLGEAFSALSFEGAKYTDEKGAQHD